ncbi:MAG: endonuclease III [Legionellales bacterium]|nr:endonuclease III [Legionellales bacterium]|tara:strand:- start:790 stop:1419 length:630 start_codon:yes stop_codon:yes gene_type:complete
MAPKKIQTLFEILSSNDPDPQSELNWSTPFELLVAVLLSAQATDVSVNKATEKLFAVANTPRAILALGESSLIEHIKTIGLFNNKAKNVIRLCAQIIEEHQGEVPASREALESLPGVGRKTANVVLNVAFNQPTIAVDTHIFRVSNRLGLAPGKNPLAVEQMLEKKVPETFKQNAHHWLLLHGRYICTARKPKCSECIVEHLCEYPDKG